MTPGEVNTEFCKHCGTKLVSDSKFCHNCGRKIIRDEYETAVFHGKTLPEDNTGAKAPEKLPRLYHVSSVVGNFRYKGIFYDNLKVNWFVSEREEPPVPFEKIINDYNELSIAARVYPEKYILERFTTEEAGALKTYLSTVQHINASIDQVRIPVEPDKKGYRSMPAGPGIDFILLYKKANYNLPFKVEGIFDIRLADERIVPDEQQTVISRALGDELKKRLS